MRPSALVHVCGGDIGRQHEVGPALSLRALKPTSTFEGAFILALDGAPYQTSHSWCSSQRPMCPLPPRPARFPSPTRLSPSCPALHIPRPAVQVAAVRHDAASLAVGADGKSVVIDCHAWLHESTAKARPYRRGAHKQHAAVMEEVLQRRQLLSLIITPILA